MANLIIRYGKRLGFVIPRKSAEHIAFHVAWKAERWNAAPVYVMRDVVCDWISCMNPERTSV